MRSVGDRLHVSGGARAVVFKRSRGSCERCGLEWPWALYLFAVEEGGSASSANLVALCGACSAGRAGPFTPLLSQPTLRERMRAANNRRSGALPLNAARRRKLIAERGRCCEICGVSGADRQLDVHHRLGILRGGDDSEKNLLVLCFACHHHLQPCAAGCGRWAKKPAVVCRRCQDQGRLISWSRG